uniref:Uncharacterized protein n=1 Tax=Cucumis melo TaxID=3656 RepID=A0A9I9DT67_CUCME
MTENKDRKRRHEMERDVRLDREGQRMKWWCEAVRGSTNGEEEWLANTNRSCCFGGKQQLHLVMHDSRTLAFAAAPHRTTQSATT